MTTYTRTHTRARAPSHNETAGGYTSVSTACCLSLRVLNRLNMSFQTFEESTLSETGYDGTADSSSAHPAGGGFLHNMLTTNTFSGDVAVSILLILVIVFWPWIVGNLRLAYRDTFQSKQKKRLI